jgi:hypothetical protein
VDVLGSPAEVLAAVPMRFPFPPTRSTWAFMPVCVSATPLGEAILWPDLSDLLFHGNILRGILCVPPVPPPVPRGRAIAVLAHESDHTGVDHTQLGVYTTRRN